MRIWDYEKTAEYILSVDSDILMLRLLAFKFYNSLDGT